MRQLPAQPTLSAEETRRFHVIRDLIASKTSPEEACASLQVSRRQLRRLVHRVRTQGANGVMHKLRGRQSNRCLPPSVKSTVLRIYAKSCKMLGPAAAQDKIFKQSRIRINRETLRKWLIDAGLWHKKKSAPQPPAREVALFHWSTAH